MKELIEAKAMELYPDLVECKSCGADYLLHHAVTKQCPKNGREANWNEKQQWQNTYWLPNDNFGKQKAFIKGAEWLLSTLSGTPEEAEEVLKPYLWEGFDGSAVINAEQALEAMQEMYARGRVSMEDLYEQLKSDSVVEIQSLQQQLRDMTADRNEWVKSHDEIKRLAANNHSKWNDANQQLSEKEAENTRLKAEVERLKDWAYKNGYDLRDFDQFIEQNPKPLPEKESMSTVYSRAECVWVYCPTPENCKKNDYCAVNPNANNALQKSE